MKKSMSILNVRTGRDMATNRGCPAKRKEFARSALAVLLIALAGANLCALARADEPPVLTPTLPTPTAPTFPAAPVVPPAPPACAKPWIYFDLGNTIVDTSTFDYAKILYMPGAKDYLQKLEADGYPLGLIVNIPESWGATPAAKLQALKDFVNAAWVNEADDEPGLAPFDWAPFEGRIILPMKDTERKPAPILFERAQAQALQAGCAAVYQGEVPEEMIAAKQAGLFPFHLGVAPDAYLPESQIDDYVVHFPGLNLPVTPPPSP